MRNARATRNARAMRNDGVVPRSISYGPSLPDDAELRLCGDPNGRRALELGVSDAMNAAALAELGAKAMTIDPDPDRLAALQIGRAHV